jgi:hypothetical protein
MEQKGIQDEYDHKRNKQSQKQHRIASAGDMLQQVQWLT